ncbi:hypothetical protein ABZ829_27765 [Streptomyces xanthochromogenes]|uniref:hypothetical protein n=1 Tax=Streptomyces xanthochromogenes TaxID=67384 RepID=UPI0034381AA3
MAGPDTSWRHTPDNAVPPLDDDLAGTLDDLDGVHCGIDLIRDGIRLLGLDQHSADRTQTILATLAGEEGKDVLTALGLLIRRLTDPAANPALRPLPYETAKRVQQCGEEHAYETAEFAPRQAVADACALIAPS